MMNNIALMNKKYNNNNNYQIHHNQPNRNQYRSNERSSHSPNMYSNNNKNISIKNQNQNNLRAKKISKNNNIKYINQKNQNNQIMMKQLKSKQQNQIYLEGELNNFYINQPSMYENKNKNNFILNNHNNNINNNNYIQRISSGERTKNNRGMPKKSPIPVQKGFMTGKYLNSSNMSTVSKYSNNTYNASYHTPDSQLLNNISQISGYSNYSHNNLNYSPSLENDKIRPYSNHNTRTLMAKNKKNNNISYNRNSNINNKNLKRNNKSYNNLINKQNNNSPYSYKVKSNNYFNNNVNNMNIINTFNKTKYISKSPNTQSDYFINNINSKKNNNYINQNQIPNQNYYNMLNNNSFSNISSVSTVSNNLTNSNFFNKMGQNNINNIYNQNINLYNNYQNMNNNINYINQNIRPMTSDSNKRRINSSNMNKKNHINNNILQSNNPLFSLNPNEINYQNYNSNEVKQRMKMKMMLNNFNIPGNFNNINYINGYNTHSHTNKRQRSANLPARRNNNYNNINPMVNLHIINKGQIINNNYNNLNNNMNNLYVYKYDVSQNNIKQRKNQNMRIDSKRKKNIIRNNNLYGISDDEMNLNMNYKNDSNLNIKNNMNDFLNEMQKPRKNSKQKNKGMIRNNSSSGMGITGDLNNIINARNNLRMQNLLQNNNKNIYNNSNQNKQNLNHSQLLSQNRGQNQIIKKPFIAKKIRKIHHFTHVGFNGEKDKDYNQDIAFLEKNFAGNNTFLYMAVCDGHGVEGHQVSGFIKRTLPKDLSNALMNKEILTADKNKKKTIYNIIGSTFIRVNEKLISNESINSIFSGTTCVSLIYTPIKLICANIGDSRAVVGRYDKRLKKWISINLSRDHKPTEEDEAKRILKKGGRIKPFIDEETGGEVGPPRVWVKDDDVPGLAMTRSFGDRVAAIAGTICVPEIKEYAFHEGDKFVILASDGIWEFISSEECINIIGKFYENNDIVQCCEFLYEESRKRWIKEEEVVDDITMLIVFFD